MANNQKSSKQRKLSNGVIAAIVIGATLVAGVIGYLVYAAVATNAIKDGCAPCAKCDGVFPFGTVKGEPCGGSRGGSSNGIQRVDKPIIYLYPKEITSVLVRLGNPDLITTSYPRYTDGWSVLAQPDGTLTDLKTGRELYSLYWEGEGGNFETTGDGFVVKGADTSEFLEEKLAVFGLNARESEEFIVYWLPQLQENKYNYIRFASTEEINGYMPLDVDPQPDTMIRVLMLYKPLDAAIDVDEQRLAPTPSREGFTLVEWGGSKLE